MRQVGIFGKRKSGKSTLMYALTRHKRMQNTTFSSMEISGVTKVMLVDTVGVDVENSSAEKSAQTIEVALMLITHDSFELELAWINKLKKAGSSIICVITRADTLSDGGLSLSAAVKEVSGLEVICVSAVTNAGISELDDKINLELEKRQ